MTIPASDIVTVQPGVLAAGGSSLALNGVMASKNPYIPTGSVPSFASAPAVSAYFGPGSTEYALAQDYFQGYDGSTIKPGALFFAPYVDTARGAWLRSGSLAGMTLAQLQALGSGVLTVTVDGVAFTSGTIALGSATSFSNAASLISAAFTGTGHPTASWDAVNSTFSILSPTTGNTSTMTFATGSLAAGLLFTSATGATLSQGAAVDTPASAMDRVKGITQNWVSFMTIWEPNLTDKEAFATWTTQQNQRYAYVAWDTDAQAIVQGSTSCFGAIAKAQAYDGVVPVYNSAALAALMLGTIASIDFSRINGRITAAFKSQAGFAATVTDQQTATNLLANGYSFYGAYGTANQQFQFIYNGQMSGRWLWMDTFVNQVWMNSQFQLALMALLTNVPSIPYNEDGYNLVRAALLDPINAALSFGAIRTGITLSAAQAAEVRQQSGVDIVNTLQTRGWYVQVLDPGAQVRGNRGTPIINFWYTDGGAVQKINMASIDII